MSTQIAVIGLGTFGFSVATLLERRGAEVIAIDYDMDKIEEIKDKVSVAVACNANSEKVLRAQGVHEADAAVVCIGEDFQANILATVLLKKIGVEKVFSRASNSIQKQILQEVGAKEVVIPEEDAAHEIALRLTTEPILDMIPLAPNVSVAKMEVPDAFHGKTLAELQLRREYGINVIAVFGGENTDAPTGSIPKPDTQLVSGYFIWVIGDENDLAKLAEVCV